MEKYKELKDLRVQLDGMHGICLTVTHKKYKASGKYGTKINIKTVTSTEIQQAAQYIKSAHRWIGKLLHYLGDTSPYGADGSRKTVDDIQPEADKSLPITLQVQTNESKPIGAAVRPFSNIETIDYLRVELQKIIDWVELNSYNGREVAICRTRIFTDLVDAKMMLGEELGRIKKSKN